MVWAPVWVWGPKNQKCQCPRTGEDVFPCSSRESKFTFSPTAYSIQALKRLDDAHLPWSVWSSLLSLPCQKKIYSVNTLTVTSRNNVLPACWVSLSPVKVTCKINQCRKFSVKHCPKKLKHCDRLVEVARVAKLFQEERLVRTSAMIPLVAVPTKHSRNISYMLLTSMSSESHRGYSNTYFSGF